MFNLILDDFPDSFGGYPIKTDFRQALKFFKIVDSDELSQSTKNQFMIAVFFGDNWPPIETEEDREKLSGFISYYLSGGKEPEKTENNEEAVKPVPVFDYTVDSGRVLAAFRQVYGIDLRKEKLHWWEFLALFQGLPDGTKLAQVIEIRSKDIPSKADAKYKRQIKELKRLYAIDKKDLAERESKAVESMFDRW